jgi:uncharacterized protein (TIGR03000 family)
MNAVLPSDRWCSSLFQEEQSMSRQKLMILAMLALAAFLLATEPVSAQRYGRGGWRSGRGYYGGSGYYPGYSGGYVSGWGYYPSSGYAPGMAVAPGVDTRQAFSYTPATDNRARIRVRIPAGATLVVQGDATQQRGPDRLFSSPPLDPGKTYTYEMKASWMEKGEPVERTQTVTVRPNETTQVDFTRAQDEG